MHAHTFRLVLTGHISCRGGEKHKHSCCLVTSLWLHIIYYTFLWLCKTLTKYDILFLLVSLCIIQSKMPYLASIFLYRCSVTPPYRLTVLFVSPRVDACRALVMCIIFRSQQ